MKNTRNAVLEYGIGLRDCTAAAPGLLMCLMTMIMLIADVIVPGMSDAQYTVYPAIFRIINIICAGCGIFLISRAVKGDGQRVRPEVMLFGGFVICIIISTIINGFTREALLGAPARYLGAPDFVICVLGFYGCSLYCSGSSLKGLILDLYLLVAACIAILATADRFLFQIDSFRNKSGISAIFFHDNHYGYFLVMAVLIAAGYVICCAGKQRIYGYVSLILNLGILALNQTLGCIIAVGAALFVLVIVHAVTKSRYLRRSAILFCSLVAMAVLLTLIYQPLREDVKQLLFDITTIGSGGNHGYAGHLRWLLWTETSGLIMQKPLAGYGCEGIRQYLLDTTGVANPHNEVLTYAAFFGIPAAAFYVIGVIAALRRALTQADQYAMSAGLAATGYFISSLFGVGMFYTLPFLFILLGLSRD